MRWLRRTVVGFLLLKLTTLVVNIFTFPTLHPRRRRPVPGVSLLVPVRDEADHLPSTLPGLLAQSADEVIFLDDGSTDGSAELLAAAVTGHPHARVIRGTERPAGWTGKTWACHQLAQAATGTLLVFCDADIALAEGAVDAVRVEMQRQRSDVFSVFPRQRTGSRGEQLLVPLIDDVLLCFLPFALLDAPAPSAATANGSLMAFRRDSYDRVGGFAAVRTEVVEDVALARLTRRRGLRLGLALGGEMVQARMYDGWAPLVTGFGRGVRAMADGSPARLLGGWGWHLLAYTLPALLAGRDRRWLLPLLLGALERYLVEAKTGRRQWWQAALMPATAPAAWPVIRQALRAEQTWKGRTYS